MKPTITTYAALALLCLAGTGAKAQTFTWGNATPSSPADGKTTLVPEKNIYKVYSRYNDTKFNTDVTVTPYSVSDLKAGSEKDISMEKPTSMRFMPTFVKMFEVKGTNTVTFFHNYDSSTEKNTLYTQIINLETGVKSTLEPRTEMPERSSDYYIAQSENKQFYAVLKSHSHDKKKNEKLNVVLLDNDFKVIKEITYETQYMNKEFYNQNIFVSNTGGVFIVKETDLAKMKPFKAAYFWDGKGDTMKETSLKFDNDYQIYQYNVHFSGADVYFAGLYTRIGAKGVQVYGGGKPAAGVYMAKFNAQGDNVYKMANETGEIPGLNFKDFVIDGMKSWIFADKMFVSDKNKTINGKPSFEKDYTYKNEAIFTGHLDNETGRLEWNKVIAYEEANTMNDGGAFLSFLYFIRDGQVTLLYNDTQKTEIHKRMMQDRFTAIETYDGNGNQVAKSLVPETGLELKYNASYDSFEENFDLDTSFQFKVSEGKYIVRAKSNGNEKLGYLTF
jgi:hypothetical protein